MSKYVHPDMIDGGFDAFIAAVANVIVCTGDPIDYAAAVAASRMTVAFVGADVTKANGDVSGRKMTHAAQTGNLSASTGQADTICYTDGSARLLHKTDISNPQLITAGNPVDIPAIDREVLAAA